MKHNLTDYDRQKKSMPEPEIACCSLIENRKMILQIMFHSVEDYD